MSTQNIPSLDGLGHEAIHSLISQNILSYLKMFSMRKNITVEDSKKGMNVTNFITTYTNIYPYILCDKNDLK